MHFLSQHLDHFKITLAQVTVILGANGSGKSSVLREARDRVEQICPNKNVVYVEGGRAITLKNSLQPTAQNYSIFSNYHRAKGVYEGKRQQKLSERIYDALMMFDLRDAAIKSEHSDAVQKWYLSDKTVPCPTRIQTPLEKVFQQFHELFPRIELRYNVTDKSLTARKDEKNYEIERLSDGEKQVFSILVDFVELADVYGLIVVDEPELNLHPGLAGRVWDLIETEYPDRVFVYATHSLSFAMRENVKSVLVLSDRPANTVVLHDPTEFSNIELQEFLGSIPGIITANKVVVTEGTEKSFDAVFYRWLLGDDQVEIMPAGGCEQVIKVSRREGIWSKIAAKVSLIGVIDRDFGARSNAAVVVLAFREAESYLGIPALAVAADEHLSVKKTRLDVSTITKEIISQLMDERLLVCAKLVAANCGIRLGVSVKNTVLNTCTDKNALLAELKQSSQGELAKAVKKLGDEAIEKLIDEIDTKIEDIVKSNDWAGALEYIDGKKIGNTVARVVGSKNSIELMRTVAATLKVMTVPEVKSLADRVAAKLALQPIEPVLVPASADESPSDTVSE